jgi:hypothetical protein
MEIGISQWEVESPSTSVKVEQAEAILSELAPGTLKAAKVEWKTSGWERSFRDVSGRTALQGTRLQLGDVKLMDGMEVVSLVADLKAVGSGRVDLEMHARAFGGELRVHGQAVPGSDSAPLEASGTFSKIGVAPLAAFWGVTEAAGGTLEEGKFSFRGSPSFPDRGTATLRLEARHFQWESRQWDSLVVGASLLERRVQIPEFSLQQGHNLLEIHGDMQWPGGGQPWWKADFGMNVTARIGDLTELSALLLPEFKYTAGGLTVDGAIRSQAGVLGGALIVTGSKLKWRNAPIEELNAAVKLEGADIRVLNAELVNRADSVRAKGVIHVGDAWWYQGELRASVGDLANYADLFQPPLVSEPFAGEARGEWKGRGSSVDYEGHISASFEGVRPMKPRGSWPRPLQGRVEGKYGVGGVELELLQVGDERVSLRTRLVFDKQGVRLEKGQFLQENRVALEGSLLLPEALWRRWPSVDWSQVLSLDLPLEMSLHADGLTLSELGRLPGMPAGWKGELSGDWVSQGTLRDLKGEGALTFRGGGWPVAFGMAHDFSGKLEWRGRSLKASELGWTVGSGRYQGAGELEWKDDPKGPTLSLQVECAQARWENLGGLHFPEAFPKPGATPRALGVAAVGRSDWRVSGLLPELRLSGEVAVNGLEISAVPDLRGFWAEAPAGRRLVMEPGPIFLRNAKLQVRVSSPETTRFAGTEGTAKLDLQIGGTVAKPDLKGDIRLTVGGGVAGKALRVDPLVLRFQSGQSEPELEIRSEGKVGEAVFGASAVGPLSRPLRDYTAQPPLTSEAVRAVFEEGKGW